MFPVWIGGFCRSAIIDPLGRVAEQRGVFESVTLVGEVRMLDRETLYETIGDWPGYRNAIALASLLFARRWRWRWRYDWR